MDKLIAEVHHALYRKTFDGWIIPKRKIKDCELVLITAGKGYVGIEGRIYTAKPGMLFCFMADVEHFLKTDLSDPMCFYAVHFDSYSYDSAGKKWDIRLNSGIPVEDVSEPENFYILKDILKSLNTHWKNKFQGHEVICNALLQQLIFEVYNSKKYGDLSYNVRNKIEKAIDYIHNNINDKISVSELSEMSGLNYSYFSCVFKQVMGCNATEFINRLKIDRAKMLLSEGNLKVKEIAHTVGFEDEFYFSRVFKKVEGISPTRYCREHVETT